MGASFFAKKGVTLEVHPQNPSSGLNRIGAACFYVMFKAATRTKKRSLSDRKLERNSYAGLPSHLRQKGKTTSPRPKPEPYLSPNFRYRYGGPYNKDYNVLGSIWVPPFEPRYTLPASTPIILPCIIPHITPNLRNGTRAVGSRPLLGTSPPIDVEGLGFGGFHKSEVPFGGVAYNSDN